MVKKCPFCGKVYNRDDDFYCLKCNYRLEQYSQQEIERDRVKLLSSKNSNNIPKCPTCGSTNIKKLSAIKRATHAYAFGLFSKTARSQFECQNCHYKW